MSFKRLTKRERKALQQGLLTGEQAAYVSARAQLKNPEGFWGTTWGNVIRGLGTAALALVPYVGIFLAAGSGAAIAAKKQQAQRDAQKEFAAAKAAIDKTIATAQAVVAPPPNGTPGGPLIVPPGFAVGGGTGGGAAASYSTLGATASDTPSSTPAIILFAVLATLVII